MRIENELTGRKRRRTAWHLSAWLLVPCSALATSISSFQAGDSSWHLGTLGTGNLDGGPDLEIVVPYRDSSGHWFLDAFKFTGQRLPGFPYSSGPDPINTSPTLYDLDGDGRDEILFTSGNRVIALRGNGSVLWSTSVNASNYVPNGGYHTVTGGFYWYPGGSWMAHLPATAVFSSEVSPPLVADLNHNGKLEVITAWKIQPDPSGAGQDYNPFILPIYGVGPWGAMGENWSGGVVTFDASSGARTFVYHLHHLVEAGLATGHPKPAGPLQIYELNDSDSVVCFDKSQPFGLWGKRMLYRQFGKNQRLMTGSYLYPIDIYTADLDGDGLDEVLVAGTEASSLWQPNETILDDDGAVLWRRWLPHLDITNHFGWLNSASLIPCNPDHDNHVDVLGFNHSYEITFRYWNGVELVDRPGWPKNFYPLLPTPPVVGDVDGDGQEEIVIGTYNPSVDPSTGALMVFALDGTLKQDLPVPGGIKHIPALAPVEGNGRLDVVFRSTLGEISVINLGATGTNLVSWSTHRGNMRRDGNAGVSLYPPGTPLVMHPGSALHSAILTWTNASQPEFYRIYRAEQAEGPFQAVITFSGAVTTYTNDGLKTGWQYFYEVAAINGTNQVLSAPVAITPQPNGNLIGNAGFERDDNCRWDKWFTGSIEMTNMVASTNVAHQGKRSMQIIIKNQGDNSTIAQFNQYGIPDSTLYVTPGTFYSFGCYFKNGGFSSPSEHWLEWSSTRTAYDTNSRPPLPDPFYYTPHLSAAAAPEEWTYVNRTFQLPPGFPNIELRHRYSINGTGSGSIFLDDVFFRQIPAPSSTNWTVWVPFGARWSYATNAPPGWTAPAFDDSAWAVGKAKFGNGSGPTNITTRLPQCLPAYYFRTRFVATDTNLAEVLLSATCTDVSSAQFYPLQVYLNGKRVPASIEAVTGQGNQTRYFDLTPFAALVQPGTNVLAVQLGNWWSDYDDLAFDISLRAISSAPSLPNLNLQCQDPSTPILSAQTPRGSVWRLQSTDSLAQQSWQTMLVFTNSLGAVQIIQDAGQGGRQPPNRTGMRYYRLTPF